MGEGELESYKSGLISFATRTDSRAHVCMYARTSPRGRLGKRKWLLARSLVRSLDGKANICVNDKVFSGKKSDASFLLKLRASKQDMYEVSRVEFMQVCLCACVCVISSYQRKGRGWKFLMTKLFAFFFSRNKIRLDRTINKAVCL